MRHGFKAEAERRAVAAREQLGVGPMDPIDPWVYAELLGVVVLSFEDLGLDQKHVEQLLQADPESWSGLTLRESGRHFVLVNPSHTIARQVSTMMHEIAHIVLNHVPKQVDISAAGLMLLSDYPADQEEEADWLAAAILLPREAMCHYRKLGWTSGQLCGHFGVSSQLCDWRLRMTGVDIQMRRSKRA
ncbi:MAG: ImmA/IrrE family metallo-endopeptidase [Alphaproteobacteria bacterium]|nr:MAG: ImmA/IrrE family metallo-endopeptidase [Alphaproteobacteria bacterium]